MFRRALTSLRTASTKNNEITSIEASVMDECIADLTNEIFELEDQRKNLRQYLYIVGLEIKRHLPSSTSERSRRLSSFPSDSSTKLWGDVDFVRTSVEELLKSCTPSSPPREISQKNRRDSITQCPSSMIERPERLAADRTKSPRTSLNRKGLWIMTARTVDRKVRLNWMVLKKTELEVEVDKLQSDSKFWGSVYEQVEEFLSSLNREIESNQLLPGIKQRPSLIRRNANKTAETVVIQKKNFPVRSMLERMTGDYTSQVGQSNKAMKDDSGVQEIRNDSSNEEKKPRNDSGVGMEPEVEIAQQHFANTSYDADSLLANACI